MRGDFLPRLAAGDDAAEYVVRLRLYLDGREHATPPEGRALPERDESSLYKGN